MRIITLSCVLLAACILCTSGCWQATDPHETATKKPENPGNDVFPSAVYDVLANADELEVYSLQDTLVKEGFHGWKTLGKTAVT